MIEILIIIIILMLISTMLAAFSILVVIKTYNNISRIAIYLLISCLGIFGLTLASIWIVATFFTDTEHSVSSQIALVALFLLPPVWFVYLRYILFKKHYRIINEIRKTQLNRTHKQ